MHQTYGSIVRIAPNVSFRCRWGRQEGHILVNFLGTFRFQRNPSRGELKPKSLGRPESIIIPEDPADREYMRKIQGHGFMLKALSTQEAHCSFLCRSSYHQTPRNSYDKQRQESRRKMAKGRELHHI